MSVLSTLLVALEVDTSDYDRGLDSANTKAGSITKSIGAKFGAMGAKMRSMGAKATAGITLPIVGLGVAAVNAASDFEEALNKVNVVFEGSADTIAAFAGTAPIS